MLIYVLPESLKRVREGSHISQQFLADIFNLSVDTIQAYEQGLIVPSPKVLYQYSEYFDIELIFSHKHKHPKYYK